MADPTPAEIEAGMQRAAGEALERGLIDAETAEGSDHHA